MNHHNIAITCMGAGPNTQRGNGRMYGNLSSRMRRYAFHNHSTSPRLCHSLHIPYQGFLLRGGFPFDLISSLLQHFLRQEADMTHYGNTGLHNSTDISCLGCPPFQLDSIRSSQNNFFADCTACSTVS